jgi:protein-S-isoprenylcysteine O-methyltransferase Ste14
MNLLAELAAALPAQLPLALGWLVYALFHSLTASIPCKQFCQRRWPRFFAAYRLFYNGLAVVLLIPLAALSLQTPGPQLWAWTGATAWLINGLTLLVLFAFLRSGGGYDLIAFLGLRPPAQVGAPRLVISQWHRFVRHPWYCLALVLIWTRDMSASSLVSASAITLYFLIGSRLEERKLVAEFGERYREYQRRVPGLVPRPWRVLSKDEARRLAG